MCHPEELGPPLFFLYASTSGGVLASLPGQNGQKPTLGEGWVNSNSEGRLPRSVDIITHLPTMGSFLSSGICHLLGVKGDKSAGKRKKGEKTWGRRHRGLWDKRKAPPVSSAPSPAPPLPFCILCSR